MRGWISAGCSLLLTPLLWLFAVLLRRLGRSGRLGFDDDRDVRCLPAVFALLFILDTLQAPVANIVSQTYEHRADDYALHLLEKPEAFRSLMIRLALINASDVHPPLWMQVQWKSHPPVVERAEHAEKFAKERGIRMPEANPRDFFLPPEFQKKLDDKRRKAALR